MNQQQQEEFLNQMEQNRISVKLSPRDEMFSNATIPENKISWQNKSCKENCVIGSSKNFCEALHLEHNILTCNASRKLSSRKHKTCFSMEDVSNGKVPLKLKIKLLLYMKFHGPKSETEKKIYAAVKNILCKFQFRKTTNKNKTKK